MSYKFISGDTERKNYYNSKQAIYQAMSKKGKLKLEKERGQKV